MMIAYAIRKKKMVDLYLDLIIDQMAISLK